MHARPMVGKVGRSGAKKSENPREHKLMIRLNDTEKTALVTLLEAKNSEIAPLGVTFKPPDLYRWLVQAELERRGLV